MFEKFGYPEVAGNGEQILTTRTGIYKEMMMDIRVYQLKAGEKKEFLCQEDELAILLLSGEVEYRWENSKEISSRKDVFTEGLYCLHVPKKVHVMLTAVKDSEVLAQVTENETLFESRFYTPSDCSEVTVGEGMCGNTAVRLVRTVFDYSSAPYSNMVLGEVISRQGSWSSYIPHYHPQPEVYYYKFDKPQGFGACFIGDEAFKITDGSFCAIPGGLTHPQVTAPGYSMYTCWMIRHFDGNPWTDRIDAKEHLWILEQNI